jgi:hypothetical protein
MCVIKASTKLVASLRAFFVLTDKSQERLATSLQYSCNKSISRMSMYASANHSRQHSSSLYTTAAVRNVAVAACPLHPIRQHFMSAALS